MISARSHRADTVVLALSNLLSFVVIGLSYFVYSSRLTPEEFGLYSVALTIASFGNLVLDGGVKSTIVKSAKNFTRENEGSLLCVMIISSVSVVTFMGALHPLGSIFNLPSGDYQFLAIFSGVYWLSYPWVTIPTAFLERNFRYRDIAFVEFLSVILERAFPSLLLLTNCGMYSFVWAALLGRVFRMLSLNLFYPPCLIRPSIQGVQSVLPIFYEGLWLQFATMSSLLRDNLHIILVGFFFGRTWVGYYAWVQQICSPLLQVFSQAASRISIPVFSQAFDSEDRWSKCLSQIRLLTTISAPIVISLYPIIKKLDVDLFNNKWQIAISILPMMLIRTVLGISSPVVANFLMVQCGNAILAKAMIIWAIVELSVAGLFVFVVGSTGLALSYVVTMVAGMCILISFAFSDPRKNVIEMLKIVFFRPSLIMASILTSSLSLVYSEISDFGSIQVIFVGSALSLIICYLSEVEIRGYLKLFFQLNRVQ
jgi:O-antigen/teichoic acid export membrane protein